MKCLNNVRYGIYSIDDFKISPAEELAVAVHPFFISYHIPEKARVTYFKSLHEFFNEFASNILILEEKEYLEQTAKRCRRISKETFNRFLIETNAFPYPNEIGWDGVKSFIKEFDPKRLKILGGFHTKHESYKTFQNAGCLNKTIDILKPDFKDIEIVEGCTF